MTNITTINAATSAVAIVEQAPLLRALTTVNAAVERRNTIPILSNLHLFADGIDVLVLRGTDLDVEIEARIFVDAIDSRFSATVPGKSLLDLVKKAKGNGLVTLTAALEDPFQLDVAIGAASARLPTLPSDDWPHMLAEFKASDTRFDISGSTFHDGLEKTRGSISTEETRYYLNGVYVHRLDKDIVFAATDGHRLATQTFAAPDGTRGMPGVIIPRKTVELLYKLTKDKACPSTLAVTLNDSKIRFEWPGSAVTVTSKLIDGTFPDYQRVSPTGEGMAVTMDSVAFLSALSGVTAAHDKIAVKLLFEGGVCTLAVSSPDTGTSTVTVACSETASSIEIGFNHRYLASLIKTACPADEKMTMVLTDPGAPTIIRGGSPRFKAVCMPMRV